MISDRAMSIARLCVLIGAGLLGVDAWLRPTGAAFAYLAAFGAVFGLLVGALALLAMTRSVGARWFTVLRGLGNAVASPTVLLPLLFLPVALMLPTLYDWAGAHGGASVAVDAQRARLFGQPWLGRGLFLSRAAVYLALWLGYAELVRRGERDQAAARESWFTRNQVSISALALPMLGFTGSWAAFDWLMSAVPGWNMTGVGLYVVTGGFSAALGVLALLVHSAKQRGLLPPEVGRAHSLAVGRLLFASVCLWAYLGISQLIIVWIGNLPREADFVVSRSAGVFRYFALGLLFGHFLVPFFLLLSRPWKERTAFVAAVGAGIVLMHALDLYWLLAPSSSRGASPLDCGPFLLLGGLGVVVANARFMRARALPLRDPDLSRSLGYESP